MFRSSYAIKVKGQEKECFITVSKKELVQISDKAKALKFADERSAMTFMHYMMNRYNQKPEKFEIVRF